MKEHEIRRLVLFAGAGFDDPKGNPELINQLINFLLKTLSCWVQEDKKRTVQLARRSALAWTVVGVLRLTNSDPTGEANLRYGGKGMGFQITRADRPARCIACKKRSVPAEASAIRNYVILQQHPIGSRANQVIRHGMK